MHVLQTFVMATKEEKMDLLVRSMQAVQGRCRGNAGAMQGQEEKVYAASEAVPQGLIRL